MDTLFLLAYSIAGGWISRMCGGGWPQMRAGLEQWLYAAPYAVVIQHPAGILAFIAALLGKRMGHGQYIHLGDFRQPEAQDEKIDGVLRFFFGVDRGGNYWRCVAGLALTGLVVTLPAGFIYAYLYSPLGGLLLALSGGTKPLGYMLGRLLFRRREYSSEEERLKSWQRRTICGEFGSGFLGWGSLSFFL